MNRSSRARLGQETVDIVQRGSYSTGDATSVDISDSVAACLADTILFAPAELDELVDSIGRGSYETVFVVRNETTLSAARRLVVDNDHAISLCLNFASAKNPGGGFLGGSLAQEESLARSSALYASLLTQPEYYSTNKHCGTALYTDYMILSPDVPVFRDDEGNLLRKPYQVGILTAPAVNAGAVRKNEPKNASKIRKTMAARIAKVLAVAAHRRYEYLILGAWGCGVFQNDPNEIAELFADSLLEDERFLGRFRSITFAVLDRFDDHRIIKPFQNHFEGRTHV